LEIWKSVKDYKNLYQVSNLGRFKSLARKIGEGYKGVNHKLACDRIIKPFQDKRGYQQVQLWKNGKCKVIGIHRLLLQTFKLTNNKKLEVNHKDGNKSNNLLSNLEWVTSKGNKKHAFETGLCDHRRGEKLRNAKLKNKDINKIRNLYSNGTTQKEIANKFKVGRSCINGIIHKRGWKHINEVKNDKNNIP